MKTKIVIFNGYHQTKFVACDTIRPRSPGGSTLMLLIWFSLALGGVLIGCQPRDSHTKRIDGMKIALQGISRIKEWNGGFSTMIATRGQEILVVRLKMETNKDNVQFDVPELHSVQGTTYTSPQYRMDRDISDLNRQKYTVEFPFQVQIGELAAEFVIRGQSFNLRSLNVPATKQ